MEGTGTATFFQRFELTQRLEDMIKPVFAEAGITMCDYGQNVILGHNGSLEAYLKKLKSKKSTAALVVKYAPDFLCVTSKSDELFFVDIKTSLTPVLFDSKLAEISSVSKIKTLSRDRVGVIEREAWDNYRDRFPSDRTAILVACPYHRRLLVMEWASKVTGLYRFKEDTNPNAAGSQTPHQNIDLGSMRTVKEFLSQEFGVTLPDNAYDVMVDFVKSWPLSNPGRPWSQFNSCIEKLQYDCPWLRRRNKDGWMDPPEGPAQLKF